MFCERLFMSATEEIMGEIGHAAGLIDAFRQTASAGNAIDLSGLDSLVETLCASIATLPAADRNPLKSKLLALIDDLNRLVEILETQQQGASDELKGISSRHRAVSAYGKGADANAIASAKKPK